MGLSNSLKANQMSAPVRLGLIGAGGVVQNLHAPALLANRDVVSVCAIADLYESNLDKLGAVFEVPADQRYRDYRDMLEGAEIDAVSIATPHSLHAPQAIESAAAGKAVVCEKPMATSREEADEILAAVRRHGVPYTVVQNFLFSPATIAAKQKLQESSVGAPFFGRVQSMGRKPPGFSPSPTDAEALRRRARAVPGIDWKAAKSMGGGCISDTAYHEIYSLQALMGSPVRYVQAQVRTQYHDVDVDDMAVLLCEHANGAVSMVTSSWWSGTIRLPDGSPAGGGSEVYAPGASLRVDHRGKEAFIQFPEGHPDAGVAPLPVSDDLARKWDISTHTEYFGRTYRAIADGAELPVTPEAARQVLGIVDAAREATQVRHAVEV